MARWRESVVTEYGEQLLAEVVNGECNIQFVKASIGCGIYSEEEMSEEFLKRQSGMRQVKNEYAISSVSQEKNVVTLKVLMGNASVKEGYPITELGLWARRLGSSDEPELYSIVLADVPDYFPDSSTPTTVKHAFQMIFASNDVKVCIAEDMGAYVLVEDFNESIEKLDKKKVNEEDIHDWARDPEKPTYNKEEIGLGNVDNTADKDKPLSTAMQEAIQDIYEQATAFAVTKIAELINGAPATADTLKELADLIADNKSVVEALDAAIGKKANQLELDTHTNNSTVHITASERTKWNNVDNKMDKNYAVVATGTDLNRIVTTGLYFCNSSYTYTNMPPGVVNGYLVVMRSGTTNNIKQVFYRQGTTGSNDWHTYVRTGTTSSFGPWVRLITEKDTATASAAGLMKLYTSTGTSTDGTMTRAAITDQFNKCASNTWRYIVANGTTVLTLPSELLHSDEMVIHIQTTSSPFYCYSWTVIPGMLNADGIALIDGYKTGNYEGVAQVNISNTTAKIISCTVGNIDYKNNCNLILYYRT